MPLPQRDMQAKRRAMLLIGLLGHLPLSALYAVSTLLYFLLYHILRYQRRLLFTNLRRAFPEKTPADIRQLAASSYRHALDFLFESIKTWRMDEKDFRERVEIENPQLMDELLKQHKVILALTSHCGNWEWLLQACAVELKPAIAALYNPLNHPGIDACLLDLRTRFGSTLIEAHHALAGLAGFARQGGIIALNADQCPRPEDEKHWADFLGVETAFFTGPEKLAHLFNCPVVYVHMRRFGRGKYSIRFETLVQPPYQTHRDAILSRYIETLESQIRSAPADWFWLYKRWKYKKPIY